MPFTYSGTIPVHLTFQFLLFFFLSHPGHSALYLKSMANNFRLRVAFYQNMKYGPNKSTISSSITIR